MLLCKEEINFKKLEEKRKDKFTVSGEHPYSCRRDQKECNSKIPFPESEFIYNQVCQYKRKDSKYQGEGNYAELFMHSEDYRKECHE